MQDGKLIIAQEALRRRGYVIPDDVVLEVLDSIKGVPRAKYQTDDFVAFYEGMGETGHGMVIGRSGSNYRIRTWTHDPVAYPSYVHTVTQGDMRGLSSPEKAQEYFDIRSGKA